MLATRGSRWQIRFGGGKPVWVDVRDYSEVQVLRRTGLSVPAGFGLGLLAGLVVSGALNDCSDEHSCSKNFYLWMAKWGGSGAAIAWLSLEERWVPLGRGIDVGVRPTADRRGRGVGAALRVSF